ncbi:Crp/Fnr family transcriptional regulator [Magnetofaba australis]|uniref:Putative Crp/Fnr family transcriptional regulator n=1 Tax=Magnetofaba australis IT-1 TaxID=1434232 RepID=A0A1Y2K881_9PROT|nr:Crp/Fnr family transcriptional regulator [Magnetofaba australis]OSM06839.1 putative Crp/Fnr family transcriptional regulator [Magnetofaba australis IT-1]
MLPLANTLPDGQRRRYEPRAIISDPSSRDDLVFMLQSGRARIYLLGVSREQTLGELKPGGIFVTHAPVWVEALETTEILAWPMAQLRALIVAQPDIAMAALREVGKLLQSSIDCIEGLAFHSVEGRLARFLLAESSRQGGRVIAVADTMEMLATRLGASRQTLSTLLNQLVKDGIIARPERQRLEILDPDALAKKGDLLSDG